MTETNHDRGALLSDHPYPRPLLRRITAVLLALGLAGMLIGVIGLLALALIEELPLLPLAALALATLTPPLLLLAVLHPHVRVYENGLSIRPLLGRESWVNWDAIARVEAHMLIQRGTTKAGQQEHFGQLIVVEHGLPWSFAVVGIMAGLGRVRAFGISTHSHVDYHHLRDTIVRQHRDARVKSGTPR